MKTLRLLLRAAYFTFAALCVGILVFVISIMIIAAATEESNAADFIHVGAVSYHFNRDAHYNEINPGIGLEHQFNERHAVSAGAYHNSERRTSVYALYAYTPLQLTKHIKLGGLIGAANGYRAHDGQFFPVALPVLMVQGKRFGANITIIPSIKEKIEGGIAVQFKWGF